MPASPPLFLPLAMFSGEGLLDRMEESDHLKEAGLSSPEREGWGTWIGETVLLLNQ